MKSPPVGVERRLTRAELEASFVPCQVCGEVERETTMGVYRITHRYELHFDDLVRPNEQRREE